MQERFAYVNGRVVPLREAQVNAADRGLLYGDGLFETIRVINRKCIRLDKHFTRLESGASILGIDGIPDNRTLADAILSVVDANNLADARVRLTITRGISSGPGLLGHCLGSPTVVITANELQHSEPQPAQVIISRLTRRDEHSPLSSVKSLNYLPNILALREAQEAGADDAILLNTQGNAAEATVGNIFLVFGSTLVTPSLDQGVLPGTVRGTVIELATSLGLEVVERAIRREELARADELFYTNAIQLVRSISAVDGRKIGGCEYPVAQTIREALAEAD
ncbi:MAG: aminotransferase class IV [Armatimonadota bacterium]|nr:aminotransferase class IV [Armatimonadota bacterium]